MSLPVAKDELEHRARMLFALETGGKWQDASPSQKAHWRAEAQKPDQLVRVLCLARLLEPVHI